MLDLSRMNSDHAENRLLTSQYTANGKGDESSWRFNQLNKLYNGETCVADEALSVGQRLKPSWSDQSSKQA